MMNAEALANRCTRCHRSFLECSGWAQCDRNMASDLALLTRAVARLEATDARNADGSLTEETEEACELLEIGLYSIKSTMEEGQR